MEDDLGKRHAQLLLVEKDLKGQYSQLQRDLHMKKLKILTSKLKLFKQQKAQRKQMDLFRKQVSNLQPTVSTMHSRNSRVQDDQIKGHLVYLLQLKDHFSTQVKEKRELLMLGEQEIKKMTVQVSSLCKDYAMMKKRMPKKPKEFVLLENMSFRFNQMEKRVCLLEADIRKQRGDILDILSFMKEHRKQEKSYRKKIRISKKRIQEILDQAVSLYEEREQFVDKCSLYQERTRQDKQKTLNHQNALNLLQDRIKELDDFEALQNQPRMDEREIEEEELMKSGRTGLETTLDEFRELKSDIDDTTDGQDDPEELSAQFQTTKQHMDALYRHLGELLEEVNNVRGDISEIKKRNKDLLKRISRKQRKKRWEIERDENITAEKFELAEASEEQMAEALYDLEEFQQKLGELHALVAQIESPNSEAVKVDDHNALDIIESLQESVLKYLMALEVKKIKELEEQQSDQPYIEEEEGLIIPEKPHVEFLDTITPRPYVSEVETGETSDVESVMDLDQLKAQAMKNVAEIETDDDDEDDDSGK